MGAPVPHVKRVHSVVGVSLAIEVYVPRVGGISFLVLCLDLERVCGICENLIEEVDVAGVEGRVELGSGRV